MQVSSLKMQVRVNSHKDPEYVETDEGISRALLKELFEFLGENENGVLCTLYNRLSRLSDINESCREGLDAIKTYIKVIVVDDAVNMNPKTGHTLTTWERTLKITGSHSCAWMSEQEVKKQKTDETVAIKILIVAESAFEALKRYSQDLEPCGVASSDPKKIPLRRFTSAPPRLTPGDTREIYQPIPDKPTLSSPSSRHNNLLKEMARSNEQLL